MTSKLILAASLLTSLALATSAQAAATCDDVDHAVSATEDFVEMAMSPDKAAAEKALGEIGATLKIVSGDLSAQTLQKSEALAKKTEAAFAGGDMSGASIAAMDLYGQLAGSFKNRLPTVLDVAMLDESGFRLRALAGAKAPDWTAVDAAVKDAGARWESSKGLIDDKAVVDLLASIQQGLTDSSVQKNAPWLQSSASMLLDSVDLLERAIKNTSREACK